MVTRVLLPLVLIAAALVGIGIVYPTVNGPFRIDCGQTDEQVCDELWRAAALEERGPIALLPVTRVRVTVTDPADPEHCSVIYIERLVFSTTISNECP